MISVRKASQDRVREADECARHLKIRLRQLRISGYQRRLNRARGRRVRLRQLRVSGYQCRLNRALGRRIKAASTPLKRVSVPESCAWAALKAASTPHSGYQCQIRLRRLRVSGSQCHYNGARERRNSAHRARCNSAHRARRAGVPARIGCVFAATNSRGRRRQSASGSSRPSSHWLSP